MLLANLLKQSFQDIEKSTYSISRREVEDLMSYVTGLSWSDLQRDHTTELTTRQFNQWRESFKQLLAGEPLAYICQQRHFYKDVWFVNNQVLIPRPETEILVDRAIECLKKLDRPQVMDFGAGSGCIGLSIAKYLPQSQVTLIDVSENALEVAKKNKQQLQVSNASLICGSIGEGSFDIGFTQNSVDMIVANPPYIAFDDQRVDPRVHNYEPHIALYAPQQGQKWIHKWLTWGYDYLVEKGLFLFEFGHGQEQALSAWIESSPYQEIDLIEDYTGKKRFFKLQK